MHLLRQFLSELDGLLTHDMTRHDVMSHAHAVIVSHIDNSSEPVAYRYRLVSYTTLNENKI